MVIVGLTGGIATGKSSVSEMLQKRGLHIVDADLIARKVVQPGHSAYVRLRKEFGSEFFDSNTGLLDRTKLGDVVFKDAEKRRKLNSVLHPAIRWEMFLQIMKYILFGTHTIVLDTPLLIESGYQKILGTIIVVWCDDEVQMNRLMLRDGLSREDAAARIASQMPIKKKMELATHLIDNNGSKEELEQKVYSDNGFPNSYQKCVYGSDCTTYIGKAIYQEMAQLRSESHDDMLWTFLEVSLRHIVLNSYCPAVMKGNG